jgi:hypothetical protein
MTIQTRAGTASWGGEPMTIIEAAANAMLGETIRRTAWRSSLYLTRNYVSLHLEVPGTHTPYLLTLEDLTARDWELDPSSPQKVRERALAVYTGRV